MGDRKSQRDVHAIISHKHSQNVLSFWFQSWKSFLYNRYQIYNKQTQLQKSLSTKKLIEAMAIWCNWLKIRKYKHNAFARVSLRRQCRIVKKYLQQWRERRHNKILFQNFCFQLTKMSVGCAFRKWQKAAIEIKVANFVIRRNFRRMCNCVDDLKHSKQLKATSFGYWRQKVKKNTHTFFPFEIFPSIIIRLNEFFGGSHFFMSFFLKSVFPFCCC